MKIQIASDLHLELWHRDLPSPTLQFAPDRTRDLLILAGDIVDGKRKFGLPFMRRELSISPVIFVPGNHEYYHATKPDVDAFWRAFADANEGFHSPTRDFIISTMTRPRSRVCASTARSGVRISGATPCTMFAIP